MQLKWIVKISEHEASMQIDRDDLKRMSVVLAMLVVEGSFSNEFEEWARGMLTKMAGFTDELDRMKV